MSVLHQKCAATIFKISILPGPDSCPHKGLQKVANIWHNMANLVMADRKLSVICTLRTISFKYKRRDMFVVNIYHYFLKINH